MAKPPSTQATQFIEFTQDDGTHIYVRRDSIVYYYIDGATYKTFLHLEGNCKLCVAHSCDDVYNMTYL